MKTEHGRRDFLKVSAGVGAGLALERLGFIGAAAAQTAAAQVSAKPMDPVRVGYVGVGGQGTGHVRNLLGIEGVEIRAVCDIVEEKVTRAQDLVEKAGQRRPTGYTRGETDFQRLCDSEDLDLVYTATPWQWHVPVCVAAMKSGKHAATEVPAAVTMDECWQMVETAEQTGKYCIMMENCNYARTEMMVLHMVRKGLLGELIHGEAGYMHDLRSLKLGDVGEGVWRWEHSAKRNGNLYPTHGLGPLAWCMDINHGDRFDYLVSMSSKARGLNLYAKEHLPPDHPKAKVNFINGDNNASLIRTVNGVTIVLEHNCDAPRPYSRINIVQGTRGLFQGYPEPIIYIEGRSPKEHEWEPIEAYQQEYDHPLWKSVGEQARQAGHGGADYLEDYRLIQALRTGTPPDLDVYDAASWSVITELSEKSVADRSRPVDFPDFTRGKWKTSPPVRILGV